MAFGERQEGNPTQNGSCKMDKKVRAPSVFIYRLIISFYHYSSLEQDMESLHNIANAEHLHLSYVWCSSLTFLDNSFSASRRFPHSLTLLMGTHSGRRRQGTGAGSSTSKLADFNQ